MPDQRKVFISYAREDREYAHALANELTDKGYEVWWDWNLVGGSNYRAEIREHLTGADRVIVLWSPHSVGSGFVIDEAYLARSEDKLVPLLIDDVSPPLGFGDIHAVSVDDFRRDIDAIAAALEGEMHTSSVAGTPTVRRSSGGARVVLLAVAASLIVVGLAAAGVYYAMDRKGSGGVAERPEQAEAAALRDYEAVQGMYGNIKNSKLTCHGARTLVEKISKYQGNTRLVPKEKAYSVFKLVRKENPTIGDLAVDRMTRMRSSRPECFQ